MTADVQVSGCNVGSCPGTANVTDQFLLVEYNDESRYCLTSEEIYGNSIDDNGNGTTDESGGDLCDSADADGCALGAVACAPASTCAETMAAAKLTLAPNSFVVSITSVDAVFNDGDVVAVPQFPATLDVISALTNGAHIAHFDGVQSYHGSHTIVK